MMKEEREKLEIRGKPDKTGNYQQRAGFIYILEASRGEVGLAGRNHSDVCITFFREGGGRISCEERGCLARNLAAKRRREELSNRKEERAEEEEEKIPIWDFG